MLVPVLLFPLVVRGVSVPKDLPKPGDDTKTPGKVLGPGDESPQAAAEKLLELFGEISRNMSLIEEMLKKKESGEACQNTQSEVSKRMDELVEELKKLQQCCSSGAGSPRNRNQQSSPDKKKKDQKAGKKRRASAKQEGRKPMSSKPRKKQTGEGKVPNVRKARDKVPPSGVAGPLSPKKGASGWGFLPGQIRALLDSEGRSGVPPRYADLIRRYFERLSEEPREK